MTPFQHNVIAVVKMTPPGRVMSYGQVAAYVGAPRAARQVGWMLHVLSESTDTPWWRIVNAEGMITIRGDMAYSKELQANFLREEGVEVGDDFRIDLQEYRHVLSVGQLKKFKLDRDYINLTMDKYE